MPNKEKFTGCTISSPHCQCFDMLTNEEQELIESKSVYVKFNAGETLCKQGSLSSHIMYIEKGLVKVFIENNQNSLVLKLVTDGNLLGLSSLKDGSNVFPYSAMAYIETHVKQIDINIFKQIINKNTAFAKGIIEMLVSNSETIHGRFFCLMHKQSYGRLADILLCMSNRIFKSNEFNIPISRKDLAELTGMNSETVIRILKKFQEDGLISIDGKSFQILDYERLVKISEAG
jgi:CRP/FNR family transcriptional regulator